MWHVFVDHPFKLVLLLKVDVDKANVLSIDYMGLHTLELVGILAESLRVFSEVDFDVGHVTNLVSCQNAENTLFLNRLDLVSLESHQVDIGTLA